METEFRITNEGELVLVDLYPNGEPMCYENGGAEIFEYWFHNEDAVAAALWYNKCLNAAKNKPILDISNLPRLQDGDMIDLSHPENFQHLEQWDEIKDLLN